MTTLRTFIERLSRGKVLKRSIRVNEKLLPIYITPDAQLKYLKPGADAFDQDLIRIAEKYITSDSSVWDVGANVGVFSFACASIISNGSVLAIEADIWLANLIRKTARFPQYDNRVDVLPAAIAQKKGILTFNIAERGRASNALEVAGGRSEMGGIRERQFVPTLDLDSLLDTFDAPNFVKIDIEGAEYIALLGAKKLINEIRPSFYIEVGQDVSTDVIKLFTQADYLAYSPDGEQLTTECAANTFFIPVEHASKFHTVN